MANLPRKRHWEEHGKNEMGGEPMSKIEWHPGRPPERARGRRLLIIGLPTNRTYDAAEDNRPDVFIGHYGESEDAYVPARVSGMSENAARPPLDVKYWAEIPLPDGVELRSLTARHIKG
jgi:hypothetical protein